LFLGIVQPIIHLFYARFVRLNLNQEILPSFCCEITLGSQELLIETVQITINLAALLVTESETV
jgi:hypothetical protein